APSFRGRGQGARRERGSGPVTDEWRRDRPRRQARADQPARFPPSGLRRLGGLLRRLVSGDLRADLLHVQRLGLGHHVRQGRRGQGTGRAEEKDLVPEDHQGGYALDVERRGELLLLVGVDLPEDHVRVVPGGLLEGRREPAAGATPGGPEVEDDDAPGLDGLPEVLVGDGSRDAHGWTGNPPPSHLQRTAATSARNPEFDSLRKSAEWPQFSWRMRGNHLQAP